MNGWKFILFAFVALSVFVSGCSSGETETEVQSSDLLIIDDLIVTPSDTVKPNSPFVVRMEVTNVGQTDVWMLIDDDSHSGLGFDGDMVLVNFCSELYSLEDGDFSVVSAKSNACGDIDSSSEDDYLIDVTGAGTISDSVGCYTKFVPRQTHVFQWKITAPSKDDIGRLTNECNFNFQIIYSGLAKTFTYVYFAAPLEVAQRIYTRDDLSLVGDNVASFGPIVANFETGEAQPISSGTGETWTVYLNLKNIGGGVAKIRDLELMGLEEAGITFSGDPTFCELRYRSDAQETGLERSYIDSQLDIHFAGNKVQCLIIYPGDERCDKENCDYLNGNPKELCEKLLMVRNKLEIFRTESSRVSCMLKVPSGVSIMQPYKFVTTAHYAYFQGRDLYIKTDPKP